MQALALIFLVHAVTLHTNLPPTETSVPSILPLFD